MRLAILVSITAGQACVLADDVDVFDRMVREATERPMTFEQAKAADRSREAFRQAMAHVARPWTFEKLRLEFQRAVWPDDAPGKLDDNWEAKWRRMLLLISFMGETRDPRAATVLFETLTYPNTDIQCYVAQAMEACFLDDPRYQPVPPPSRILMVGKVNRRASEERVREWWRLNEAAVRRDAAAMK